jgi:hypothetical protein
MIPEDNAVTVRNCKVCRRDFPFCIVMSAGEITAEKA